MSLIISSAGQQFSSGSGGGGGTATGFVLEQDGDANGFRIVNLGDPIDAGDAVNLGSMTAAIAAAGAGYVLRNGTTPMTADWNYGGFDLTNVAQLGVGTNTPGASAVAQLNSTTQGFLVPRMTSTQRDAIAAPAEGLLIYNVTDAAGFQYYDGVAWVSIGSSVGDFVRVDGSTPLTNHWDVGGFRLENVAAPNSDDDAVNRGSMNTAIAAAVAAITGYVKTDGSTPMLATWNYGGVDLTNVDQLAVGTATVAASAAVTIASTTRGFLPPRMTSTQRDAIATPAEGLLIYNVTDAIGLQNYNGVAWVSVGGGVIPDGVLLEDGTTPLTNHWDVGGFRLENVANPNSDDDAVNRGSMNTAIATAVAAITGYVKTDGSTPMTAAWNFGGFNLTNVARLAVGTNTLGASVALQVDSTTTGFLLPRMTTTQRDAIASPATGLQIYNTTGNVGLQVWDGAAWVNVGGGATPAGVLLQDGTRALTANWNVGGFDITNVDQIGIGTATAGASAALQIDSTARGFLQPRMTTTQRDAIGTPAVGLEIYNTTADEPQVYKNVGGWSSVGGFTISGAVTGALTYYNGSAWVALAPGGAGSTLSSGGAGAAPTWTTFSVGATSHFVARAVSTLPILTLSGTTTVDSVVLASGDILMLVAQAAPANNGPWIIQAGAWIRPPGFATGANVPNGHVCYIQSGTLGQRTGWRCTTAATITVGTTSLTYDGVIGWGAMSAADTDEILTWLRNGTQRLQIVTSDSSGNMLFGNATSVSILRSLSDLRISVAGGDGSATQSQFLVNTTQLVYRLGSGNTARPAFGISATESYLGANENSNLNVPAMIPMRGSQSFNQTDAAGAGLRFRAGAGSGNAADAGVTLGGAIVTGTSSGTTRQTGRDSLTARGEYVNELGGWRLRRTATATDYTVLVTDHEIGVTSTAAARTITLPVASTVTGMEVVVKDESGAAGTNNISVVVSGGGTIDGVTTYAIGTNYGAVTVASNGTAWFTLAAAGVAAGNTLVVDKLYGNDATASRGGRPYLTVAAAVGAATSGDVVFVRPGTYDEAAFTIPTGVAVRGASLQVCKIRRIGVVANTTFITMGVDTRLEDVSVELGSAGHFTLIGVLFPSTTAATAKIRTCAITVDNATASTVGTSNVYGVHSPGTGAQDGRQQAIRAATIVVNSAGLGNKRGILCDTAAQNFGVRDINVIVTTAGGAGSYIGVETNFAGVVFVGRLVLVRGPSADISQTLGSITLGSANLVNASANGLGWTSVQQTTPLVWADEGSLPSNATRYMRPGTGAVSTTEPKIRLSRRCLAGNLTVRSVVAPGAGKTDTFTVRKNGVDTTLVITLADAETSKTLTGVSASFASGDDISVKVVTANTTNTSDIVFSCELL